MALGLLAGLATQLTGVAGEAVNGGGINSSLPVNNRTNINVAPVGINLGAILQPYTDSPFNGGAGLPIPTPFASQGQNLPPFRVESAAIKEVKSDRTLPFVIIGGGLLATGVAVLLLRRR